MAIKKDAPVKGKAATAKKSTALVPWDEKFAKYAKAGKELVSTIGAVGASVKFGRGTISVGGSVIKDGKFECVVLGTCALNALYFDDYDAENPGPPDCYGFALVPLSRSNEDVNDPPFAPHAQVAKKQSTLCSDCEHKVWGTAKRGRGKLCSSNIRLALLTAKDVEDADDIASAEIGIGKVSTTNQDAWGAYVKMVEEEYSRPTWAVITEISSHDDPKTQIRLEFRFVDLINDDATLTALEARAEQKKIQDVLQQPFQAAVEQPAKKAAPKAGKSAKFAGAAKGRGRG